MKPKDTNRTDQVPTEREIPAENKSRQIDNTNIYRKSMDWLNHVDRKLNY